MLYIQENIKTVLSTTQKNNYFYFAPKKVLFVLYVHNYNMNHFLSMI